MEPPPANAAELVETSKRLARRLVTIGENRLELLTVEAHDESGVLIPPSGRREGPTRPPAGPAASR